MTLERRLAQAFLEEHPQEAALALERMSVEQRAAVVRDAPAEAAHALREMVSSAAVECLSRLAPEDTAPALDRLPLDAAIALLRRMPKEVVDRVIRALPSDKQDSLRRVLQYPDGTAGALMDPAVLALPYDISVAEARVRLRREADGLLHYLFVVDRARKLVGVLDIAELMRAHPRDGIRTVMHERVQHLPAWTPASAVRLHPGWQSFHAMPVTDEEGRLLGAIRYQTLRRLEREADAGEGASSTSITVGALGELFHLGMAGLVEGVAAAAIPRDIRPPVHPAGDQGGAR